ncbi:MAG: fibro-slime domain-containing protein [Chitinispirillaceae bacterium]
MNNTASQRLKACVVQKSLYFFATVLVWITIGSPSASAQAYPDTLWIPVTYYDFHSDGSNPEFEQDHTGGVRTGMVADTLDADRKPVLGPRPYLNHYIKYWYRDWEQQIRGDYTMPDYDISGGTWNASITYNGPKSVDHDTAFKNIVIEDSLPFSHLGGGVYEYKDDNSANFFPLNGRGFDEGKSGNNYSFTMELHTTFIMKPGITFNFAGDDDVWAFIDNRLAMDLGGIHSMERGSFEVDDLGLEPGREYNFDFFFAERHTSESHIRITTNIVSTKIAKLTLNAEPNDTVHAGDTVTAWAQTVDDTGGVHTGYGDLITWSFIDDGGHRDSTLFSGGSDDISGDTIYFTPTEAHNQVTIEGILLDTNTNEYLRDTLTLYILAGAADHLTIEGSRSVSGRALQNDQPISRISIGPDDIHGNGYAILRDTFGNYIRHSHRTDWRVVQNAGLIDSIVSGDTGYGEGIAYKHGTAGIARISAADRDFTGSSFVDSVDVVISQTNYTRLRFVINDNGIFRPIEDLTISTDQCTLITVEGYRSDGLRWEPVSGRWSTDIPSAYTPGQANQSFQFCPSDIGAGSIQVRYQGAYESLPVEVEYGGPSTMELYDFAGNPAGKSALNTPPLSYTVNAGDTLEVYAKLFDNNGYWLSEYETSTSPIAWSLIELSGGEQTGHLTSTSGHTTGFSPRLANRSVYIVATWEQNGNVLNDTVKIRTDHGPVNRLSIQADTTHVNGRDLDQITMSPRDTIRHAYAVLRDEFDNFISAAEFAQWESLDSSIAQANSGALLLGEGIILRRSDSTSQVKVVATSDDARFSDTLTVNISQITFTDIEIVTYTGDFEFIDSLSMRTDQDTMLYVIGKRSDDGTWIELSADWDITGSITTQQSAPPSDDEWHFVPLTVGEGQIIITGPDNISDTIAVSTQNGSPHSLALHRDDQTPRSSSAFPGPNHTDTINAGTPLDVVANVFDSRNTWLQQYRSYPREQNISWRVVAHSGPPAASTTLSNRYGAQVMFNPTRAYRSVKLIATLDENGKTLRDTISVYVAPGTADHLVIESGSNTRTTSPNRDAPANRITLTPTDTVKSAYAVLRDMYGNFVSHSYETDWMSVDQAIATAEEAIQEYGEGRIYREADNGYTRVIAQNRVNPYMSDTLEIELSDIYYDSLRIVEAGSQRVESVELVTGGDINLYAEGLRSDGRGWEQLAVDWHASSSLKLEHNPPARKNSWSIQPIRDGNGEVWISRGRSEPDTIDVSFLPGVATQLALYPKAGAPDITNRPLPDPSSQIVAAAGESLKIYAKLFDKNEYWLSVYEHPDSAQLINWEIVGNGSKRPTGSLDTLQGQATTFTPRTAGQTALIVASFKQSYRDTVAVRVVAGAPHHIVLEGSQDPDVSPHQDNPIDTIEITEIDTLKRVYAIVRDVYENFIEHSKITEWSSRNADLISVENGNRNLGQGLIRRTGMEGVSVVSATDRDNHQLFSPTDSVIVRVLSFYYTQLRIVDQNGNPVDQLTLSTNDDTHLFVEGLRSTGGWELTDARWNKHDSLVISPAPPENADSWSFSPGKPGNGWISVGLDNDKTISDTIPVSFSRGEPTSVEFDILSQSDDIVAGDTITTVVRIKNEDGLVPGRWCYPGDGTGQAQYSDTLGNADRENMPIVIDDEDSYVLTDGFTMDQCFNDGVDTVRFVLYYAPATSDSMHLLTVELDGLEAKTAPFRLKPGEIHTMHLVENSLDKNLIPDSLTLRSPDGSITIMSVGFDLYGNEIGPVESDWSTSGSLHDINYPENTRQIFYASADVTDNEQGYISAVYNTIADSVFVTVKGPDACIVEAVTRDRDGNGYLDAIEVRFDKNVLLPDEFFGDGLASYLNVSINDNTGEIPVNGLSGVQQGDSTSGFTILLDEVTRGEPQTGWEPRLSLIAGDDIERVIDHPVTDGAAPVIWRVIRKVNDADNRSTDKIVVVFSEPVFSSEGTPLSLTNPPQMLFDVWVDSTESLVRQPDILTGIEEFSEGTRGDSAVFYMTNEAEIAGYHSFSLGMDCELSDHLGNIPSENNQRVQVVVLGNLGSIKVGPNPMSPVYFMQTDRLLARNPHEAHGWVQSRGGAILIADFIVPGDASSPERSVHDFDISASLSIYDCMGNQVYRRESGYDFLDDISSTRWTPGTSRQLTVYWNGISDDKRPVAPGLYRVIMNIEVDGKQVKVADNLGIGR